MRPYNGLVIATVEDELELTQRVLAILNDERHSEDLHSTTRSNTEFWKEIIFRFVNLGLKRILELLPRLSSIRARGSTPSELKERLV